MSSVVAPAPLTALKGKAVLHTLLNYGAWAILFAVIYAQSPLYTSNQNQYFLHGLAQAGYGKLNEDWLASTADPTPVFSLIVRLTYTVFHDGWPFYLYYACLLGIYLFSLVGIVYEVIKNISPGAKLLFFTGFVVIHSAAFRYLITLIAGSEWTFILEGGLANQRVLGQVFQPSTFGVLLILSIYLFLKGRLYQAILAAAAAATIHPTYLLSAAVLVAAYIVTKFLEEKNLLNSMKYGLFALVSVAPIMAYVVISFHSDQAAAGRSQELLVTYRIPHHALVSEWFDLTSLFQLLMISVALIMVRFYRLGRIILLVLLPSMVLSIIQWVSGNAMLALLFPWRLSVVLVPLSTAILLGMLLAHLDHRYGNWLGAHARVIVILSVAGTVILSTLGGIRFTLEIGQQLLSSERDVFEYISESKADSHVYLIPIKMQDFRLATGMPAYVDFKSIPYAPGDVLEWYRRIQVAEDFYRSGIRSCASLGQLASQEGVTGVIVEQGVEPADCPGWTEVYEDDYYQVIVVEN